MSFHFESFVSFRYLRSKRKEFFISIITVISVLGVALSVMVLDITLAVMTGFETALQEKLVDANAHVTLRRYGGDIADYDELLTKIKEVKGVQDAFPFTYSQAMIASDMGSRGVLIRGVEQGTQPDIKLGELMELDVSTDVLFSPAQSLIQRPDGTEDLVSYPPLVIGRALRQRLNVADGSLVTLFAPKFNASPQGLVPQLRRFIVVGSYSSGLIEYESGLAYTSIASAQQFFDLGKAVTGLEVSVDNLFEAPEIAKQIYQKLGAGDSPYYLTDWTEQNKPLWDAIRLEKRVYFIVLLLLTVVASFSIMSTLVMVVMEKNKDIAILKSMGASDNSILRIFLLQGATIGAVGVVVGTIFGVLGSIGLREFGFPIDERVFSLDTVPVVINPMNMLLTAVCAFVITAVTGVYPAWRAAKLRPAEALRFE